MCIGADLVCTFQESDFIAVFDDSGLVDSRLELGSVDVLRRNTEGAGDLAVAGVNVYQPSLCSERLRVVCMTDFVNVELCLGLFDGHGQAAPWDGFGVNGGDEEGKCIGGNVVSEEGIWERAAGEIEEGTALAKWCFRIRVGEQEERGGFQVNGSVGRREEVGDFPGVGFGGVFLRED